MGRSRGMPQGGGQFSGQGQGQANSAPPAPFWSAEEDKCLEVALAELEYAGNDIMAIESGASPLYSDAPSSSEPSGRESLEGPGPPSKGRKGPKGGGSGSRGTGEGYGAERRKGVPWTEDEHRLFLLGLAKFGKGDWRSISRNFVVSRTPTQVASHAQKYFIRLNSLSKKDKRRTSIHDITSTSSKDFGGPAHSGGSGLSGGEDGGYGGVVAGGGNYRYRG